MKPSPRVVVTSPSFAKRPDLLAALAALGLEVIVNREQGELAGEELASFIRASRASALVVGREVLTPTVLDGCPELLFVAKYGVGLDNLDPAELTRRGIGLGWTGGVNKRPVSELVLGFMLSHFRNITRSVTRMRSGAWVKDGGHGLADLTVGIVGMGHIGTDLARVLQVFGCHLLYTDIIDKSAVATPLGASPVSYVELVRTADVITFHVPATPTTHHMFGPSQIANARPNALVINASRGTVVDFEATCTAVVQGSLGGFAADVFPHEPYDARSWGDCEKLYFTPHIAGNSQEAVLAMGRSAIEHIAAFFGKPLPSSP